MGIVFFVFGSTAGAAAAASEENAIASAKKDFEIIKDVARDPSRAASETVKQSVPQLELPTDRVPVLSPIQRARQLEALDAKAKPRKTDNWLLDAMNQNAADSKLQRTDRAKQPQDDKSLSVIDRPKHRDDSIQTRTDEQRVDLDAQAAEVPQVANPLAGYMARWMSPQDFLLLQSAPNSGELALKGVSPLPDSRTLVLAGRIPLSVTPSADRSMTDLSAPNPYLVESGPNSTATEFRPPDVLQPMRSPSTGVSTPPPVTPVTPAATESKSTVNDRFRPKDDARYLKQLKRF